MNDIDKLSSRERDVLGIVRQSGGGLSVREICNETGIPSPSTVHRILHMLEQNGFISLSDGKSRGAFPVYDGRIQRTIPLLTEYGGEAIGNVMFEVAYKDAKSKLFAVEAHSTIGDIIIGDIVVFSSSTTVKNGSVCAFSLRGRLYVGIIRETDDGAFAFIGDKHILLGGETDIGIVGKPLGLVRKYY